MLSCIYTQSCLSYVSDYWKFDVRFNQSIELIFQQISIHVYVIMLYVWWFQCCTYRIMLLKIFPVFHQTLTNSHSASLPSSTCTLNNRSIILPFLVTCIPTTSTMTCNLKLYSNISLLVIFYLQIFTNQSKRN